LQKEESEIEYPIHFISCSLTKAEKNYGITGLWSSSSHYGLVENRNKEIGKLLRLTWLGK